MIGLGGSISVSFITYKSTLNYTRTRGESILYWINAPRDVAFVAQFVVLTLYVPIIYWGVDTSQVATLAVP